MAIYGGIVTLGVSLHKGVAKKGLTYLHLSRRWEVASLFNAPAYSSKRYYMKQF